MDVSVSERNKATPQQVFESGSAMPKAHVTPTQHSSTATQSKAERLKIARLLLEAYKKLYTIQRKKFDIEDELRRIERQIAELEKGRIPKGMELAPAKKIQESDANATHVEKILKTFIANCQPDEIEELASSILERVRISQLKWSSVTELPIYSGSTRGWLLFEAFFRETTETYKFTPVENMARLRKSLRGKARDIVEPLLYISTDADLIMKQLEMCFGSTGMLVSLAYNDIRCLPRLGETSKLTKFAITVRSVVAVLRKVQPNCLHDWTLVGYVLKKLTPELQTRWCHYAEEHPSSEGLFVTLSAFLDWRDELEKKYM